MACIYQKSLLNPKRYFNPAIDKIYLQVPCNKCEECRKAIRDEWCVRSYFEHEDFVKRGGFSLMLLFTYSDKCVPRFNKISNYDSSDMCFNSGDINRFIDSLSKFFKRRGEEFKYIICSEYATNDDYSMRPHYHGVLHFLSSLSPQDIFNQCQKLWHYGKLSPNKAVEDLIVRSGKGIVYSSKYCTKDLDFYNRESVKKLLEDPDLVKECKHTLAHRYTSYQYGRVIEDIINSSDTPFEMLSDGIHLEFNENVYKVPRYILNRLRYNNIPDGFTDRGNIRYKREYTPFGIAYEKFRRNYVSDKLANRYYEVFNRPTLLTAIPLVSRKSGIPEQLLWSYVSDRVDTRSLARYSLFLRNRVIPKSYGTLVDEECVKYCNDVNTLLDYYFDNFKNTNVEFKLENYEYPFTNLDTHVLFNDLPLFKGYDGLILLYDTIKQFNDPDKCVISRHNDYLIKRLKEYVYKDSF